jgi:hypothetical protein
MNDMPITSAQYYVDYEGQNVGVHAVIDAKSFLVPIDPANRHYAEIMRQVEAGELTIQDAD